MKGWRVTRLGDLVEILSGFAFESEYFSDEGDIPIARIRDVVPGASSTYFTGDFDPKYLLTDGDLLVGMDGEFNRATWRGGRALLNQRVCRIRSASGALMQDYLYHLLPLVLDSIEATTPFVTVKHLSVKALQEYSVALPSVDEQHRITVILDQANALRAKRRAALAQVDGLTQAIFLEMFGDPVTNPKGWRLVPVADLAEELRYGTSEKSTAEGAPVLRIPNVVAGVVDYEDLKYVAVDSSEFARLRLVDGDLLFVRTNGNPDYVGRCAVFDESAATQTGLQGDRFIFASYLIRARLSLDAVSPVYLREFMLSPAGRKELRARAKTSAGQFNVNAGSLRAIPVPLPPVSLQRSFACRAAAVDKLKASHRASLAHLDALFASLQHRAFRGEL